MNNEPLGSKLEIKRDSFGPASCVVTRVVPINYGYPKLTGIVSSYTGIGWKYPVSKSFLPRLS